MIEASPSTNFFSEGKKITFTLPLTSSLETHGL